MHVEIVGLLREIGRSHRTGVQIKSNKRERAIMRATVDSNKLALAKAHIRLVGKSCHSTFAGVRSGPSAPDVRQPHEAVEVRYLRWVAYVCQ